MSALTNRVAVITGASSGIGRAIALRLAMEGTSLCLIGRHPDQLEAVARLSVPQTHQVRCYPVDLSVQGHIQQLVKSISHDIDRVDLLIHSAGTISMGRLESAPIEELDRQYQVNVRAPYLLTQGLMPLLRSSQGQVVFINSSASAAKARENLGQYAATKQALKALADSLRDEVNRDGIRVLSIYPGRTASPMQAMVFQSEGRAYRPDVLLQPEDVAEVVVQTLSLPPTAEVTDIHIRPFVKSY